MSNPLAAFSKNDVDNVLAMVRADLNKTVCQFTEQDKQDWRDMGWRIPRCNCKNCKSQRNA